MDTDTHTHTHRSVLPFALQQLCLLLSVCFFTSPGELSSQVLSFAANTIYMAISCSNLQPQSEPREKSASGKMAHFQLCVYQRQFVTDKISCDITWR